MKGNFPIEKFKNIETPFYYYDVELLNKTLELINRCSKENNIDVHYAVKANANKKVLSIISKAGLGADCVSGNEVLAAINAGFPASKIVFAGVGKTDKEINIALDNDIFCFNAESVPELEVINELAKAKGKIANVEIRVNPNIDAHTHKKITTGLNENKFGFNMDELQSVCQLISNSTNLNLLGLHFHIGSQITDLNAYECLCVRINELQDQFDSWGVKIKNINVGGGLGINYEHPNHIPIADFESYFRILTKYLKLRDGQKLHCEPGRSVVAQCGSLITKVTYVKQGVNKQFAIVDAGMTDLIRPALYDAYHRIENISSDLEEETYDVVGPICESSDVFDKDVELNKTKRGDYLAIRSAGAYGEIMASNYNLRKLPQGYLSTEL
ncbi:MAG: diaminopimelate decarboxylase [Paludibacteraceae bacterium]|nr:diaminopimelate decarboxylase [Paludibacteraceae bacterium]